MGYGLGRHAIFIGRREIMTFRRQIRGLLPLLLLGVILYPQAKAQTAALHGEVTDPSGAVVPRARITLQRGGHAVETESGSDGHYVFRALAPSSYTIKAAAKGFAPLTIHGITLTPGHEKELNLPLEIALQYAEVTVEGHTDSVGIGASQSSGSMVFKGKDLDALSDDPNQLQSELEELAGAAAGPNGGQIYIDGFAGGQLPPKSSILEIRVNQNPFSAEYDRAGYGRVEIITKPGTEKLHGSLSGYGSTSTLNSGNPLISVQPDYDLYSYSGVISGPMGKNASFFFSGFVLQKQNENIVDAVNPQNTAANLSEAIANPNNLVVLNPRIDFQIGKHMFTIRDYYYRMQQTGSGVGMLNLPEQAVKETDMTNTVQFGDNWVVGPRFLNELHLEWQRIRTNQNPSSLTPTVSVEGAFTGGGNNAGVVQDHQDIFEFKNYATATAGNHTLRFGVQARAYHDVNYSTAGSNGFYTFSSLAAYQAATPDQYFATQINNPVARTWIYDGSAFFQDDWRVKPNFMLGLGARYEDQSLIRDHTDWAPRVALAWSPGKSRDGIQKTVIRAGYGWFYDRFTEPNSLSAAGGSPYVIQALHDNGVNQQSFVVNNPNFFDPNTPEPMSGLGTSNTPVPSIHSIDPKFHAALNMQAGVGVDRQITGKITANVTYLFTQGVHQYLMNNVTAPAFDAATYSVTGATPAVFNYQFQSGGFYKQHQVIAATNAQFKNLSINASYTFNQAMSDTGGVTSFVSVAGDPGLDYGRASFGIRHRGTLLSSYTAPLGFVFASLFEVQSGTPYNLTTGYDLTGNNQYNARPTYGTCGAAGVIATRYGCLDTNPVGKGEPMVPFDLGTGPANLLFDLRVSKVFGVGPREKTEGAGQTLDSGTVSDQGLTSGSGSIRLDAGAPRRYNLTFVAGASNLLNFVNLAPPNGVLISPLFDKSQALANGPFANPTPGNRAFVFQVNFSF